MTGHRAGREDDSAQMTTGTEGRGTDEQNCAGTPRVDVRFPVLDEGELGGLRDVGQARGRPTDTDVDAYAGVSVNGDVGPDARNARLVRLRYG